MSMTMLCRAMTKHLGELGLPVYAEEQVPEGAGFPYVTFSAVIAPWGEVGDAAVTCWAQDDWLGCLTMGDRAEALFGPGGTLLKWRGGTALAQPVGQEVVSGRAAGVVGCRVLLALSGMP